jgi:hypothetical protein
MGVPALPWPWPKLKLKAKEAVLRSTHPQHKTLRLLTELTYLLQSTPRRNKVDHCATILFPLTTKSTIKRKNTVDMWDEQKCRMWYMHRMESSSLKTGNEREMMTDSNQLQGVLRTLSQRRQILRAVRVCSTNRTAGLGGLPRRWGLNNMAEAPHTTQQLKNA